MSDSLIPLSTVPKIPWLPQRRGSGRLHVSTVWRWCLKGLRARDGTPVKLRALRVGQTLCTSEQWLQDFFEQLTAHDPALAADKPVSAIRTPGKRRRASERAAEELEREGI